MEGKKSYVPLKQGIGIVVFLLAAGEFHVHAAPDVFAADIPALDVPPALPGWSDGQSPAAAKVAPTPLFNENPEPVLEEAPTPSNPTATVEPRLLSAYAPVSARDGLDDWTNLGMGFGLNGSLSAGVSYDDNVYLGNGKDGGRGAASFFESPSISIFRGGQHGWEEGAPNSLALDYSTTFRQYEDHVDSELDHNFRLNGSFSFQKLTLDVHQGILIFSDAAFNGQSERQQRRFYTTNVGLTYPLTTKLSLNGGIDYAIRDFEGASSSQEISGRTGFSFAVRPKLYLGANFAFGYLDPEDSSSQTYESYSLTASYHADRRFDFHVSAGLEERQLDAGSHSGFVYSGGVDYHPRDRTALSLSLYRRNDITAGDISPVAGESEDSYTATGVSLSVSERFLDRYTITATTGYENASSYSSRTGKRIDRDQDYFYAQLNLNVPIGRRWSVMAGYVFRTNSGSGSGDANSSGDSNFTNNQASLSVKLSF